MPKTQSVMTRDVQTLHPKDTLQHAAQLMERLDVVCCQEDDDIEQLQQTMCESQVRRVPIIGRDDKLVGIVSLGDLALRQNSDIEDVVREVSTPS